MFDDAVKKFLENLEKQDSFSEEYPKFSSEDYKPFAISVKRFHQIKKKYCDGRIAFVDGGNAEIIGSASFSLSLIRIGIAVYSQNKKIFSKKIEFLLLVNAVNEDNEICYKTSFFGDLKGINFEYSDFSSTDKTISNGVNRAEIGSVASAIRRFSELLAAKSISAEKKADIVMLDGNLQCTFTNEKKYMESLQKECKENNVLLASLSKTSSLFTDKGNILSAAIDRISGTAPWYYNPIAEIKSQNHRAEMYFAKLHEKSKHVFRLEIFNEQKESADELINSVASNCNDAIFVGYPYGFIEADRMARVTNQERESMKTIFLVKLKNKNIDSYLNSKNVHSILDKISF